MAQFKSVLDMDKINAVIAKEGQVIGNLVAAIDVLEAAPEHRVDLQYYVCGTNACVAGWLATEPFFVDQLEHPSTMGSDDQKQANNAGIIAEVTAMWLDKGAKYEGMWTNLFAAYMDGTYDKELKTQHGEMSHKQLGLARLHHHLKILRAQNIE